MPTKSPIPFRAFNEQGEVRIYNHGILPHWRQTGCTYFVTFRLADSIPRHVLEQIEEKRLAWLRAHRIDPAARDWKTQLANLPSERRREYERATGKHLNVALDECHGSCVLRDPFMARETGSALEFFHGERVLTGDFVVMPNNVHALMTPLDGHELEDICQSIKSYTAREINRVPGRTGQLWQRDSYDHIVRIVDQLEAFQLYIAANASKAKLRSGEYLHSRAE